MAAHVENMPTRLASIAAALVCTAAVAFAVTGCTTAPSGPASEVIVTVPSPEFDASCDNAGGEVLEDTVTHMVTAPITGTVTGSVVTSNGQIVTGTGVGTGVGTALVTLTLRQCIVGGEVTDMEVVS